MKIALDSDKSISLLKDDSFQRYDFAKRIAELIKSNTNEDSLVVGIYGRWGEGKTSVMNFISTELKKSKKNILIKFNPWMFNNEDQLLLSFFQELAIGLNTSLKSRKEKVGEFFKTYASSIGSLTTILAGGLNPKELLNSIGNKLANKPLEHYKSEINKFIQASGKRITIFIDDIDRLTVEEV